ncbi:MAG: Nramp family divalent metal transporter [Pyrinomonadaceae bacterium]|nr:Nramp family divalent metal transporter [Pyrinomonadaceae bacterium]
MAESNTAIERAKLQLQRGANRVRGGIITRERFFAYLTILGPGVIAANAGNDAGGIATYASVGAEYGYLLLWTFIPITISLFLVQEMCARMGIVTGKGLSDLIRERFGVRWTALVMLALLIANGGVTISEFVGIGLALELFGVPQIVSVPLAAVAIWWLVVKGSYKRVEQVFLVMSLVFFGYIISAFMVKPEWFEVAKGFAYPTVKLETGYLFTIVAVIGTTISPYMQVFVQSSVVEKETPIEDYALTRADVFTGTLFAMAIAFFIVVSTAATLHVQNIHIETAADAARALEPLAGKYASVLFAVGLFGASMLAAGVLPLATAYSISEALGFEKGLSHDFTEAPIFLGIFTSLIIIGAVVAILPGINPFQILLITQVINGLLLPVTLFAILLLSSNKEIMGEHANSFAFKCAAWVITIVVSILSLSLLGSTIFNLIF